MYSRCGVYDVFFPPNSISLLSYQLKIWYIRLLVDAERCTAWPQCTPTICKRITKNIMAGAKCNSKKLHYKFGGYNNNADGLICSLVFSPLSISFLATSPSATNAQQVCTHSRNNFQIEPEIRWRRRRRRWRWWWCWWQPRNCIAIFLPCQTLHMYSVHSAVHFFLSGFVILCSHLVRNRLE